jgi:hypothetical protein
MPYDASDQALRQSANLWRRSRIGEGLLGWRPLSKISFVFVIHLRGRHGKAECFRAMPEMVWS